MEQRVLAIEVRDSVGKGVARKLRAAGRIPAVVYGKGVEPVPVSVDTKEFVSAIAGEGGINHLITLKGGGSLEGKTVLVADLTRDPLKRVPTHVDLHKVSMEEKVKVKVPVNLAGTAKGVKEGGMLDFVMHTVEIECLPTRIPEHIDVHIDDLAIGGSLHVSDLVFPEGVKVLADPTATIVNILGRAVETEAVVEETE